MTKEPWQRLSHREAGLPPDETLYDEVVPHVEQALRDWIESAATDEFARRVMVNMEIGPSWTGGQGIDRQQLASQSTDQLLNVVDCMLHLNVGRAALAEYQRKTARQYGAIDPYIDPVASLANLLSDAKSAYQVRFTEDGVAEGLDRVVDATVTEAARKAGDAAENSGRQVAKARLRSAWLKAYNINQDPGGAYADALRAVEDVACPLFLPNDPRPTLGGVRAHLAREGHRYELVIHDANATPADVEALTAMIALLWYGHRDRHEGGRTSAPISPEAAQAAVHLAATLVQWLSTGTVRRVP
ncbi:hypothetical protein ABZ369_23415 [Streptomyces sp. NPDC005918]|uniref:hypothetical protein n=1 Tax=Streptomyces sp. NPDC005918 TaxID=3155454 RepID=UPI0033DA4AB8